MAPRFSAERIEPRLVYWAGRYGNARIKRERIRIKRTCNPQWRLATTRPDHDVRRCPGVALREWPLRFGQMALSEKRCAKARLIVASLGRDLIRSPPAAEERMS